MSDHHLFSKKLREALHAAGWAPGRHVDVSRYEAHLTAQGYIVTSAALDFLAEFGGLTILWRETSPDGRLLASRVVLDSESSDLSRMDVQHVEKRVGETLIPIGRYQDYETLLIGPSGKVYGEADTLLSLIAFDGYQALQSIMENAPPLERFPW